MRIRLITGLALFSLCASAAVIGFDTPAAFATAVGVSPITTQTFESFSADHLFPSGTSLDGVAYMFPAGVQGRADDGNFNAIGQRSLAAERNGDLTSYFLAGESVTLTFPVPVVAIGLYFNANTHAGNQLYINAAGGTASTGGANADRDLNTLYFVGLMSTTPFTTATFGSVAGGPGFSVDDVSYVPSAAPEPSTYMLMGAGLLLFGLRRRR